MCSSTAAMADGAEHTGRPLLRSDTAATLDGEGRMPAVPLGAVLGKVEKEEDAWRTRTEAKATAPGAQDIVLESALDDPGAAEQRGGEAGDKPRPGRPAPKEPTELQRRIKALGAEIEEAERRAAQAAIAEAKKKQQEEERDSASRGGLGGLQGSLEELGTEARVLQRMAQEQQQREDAARRRGGGSRKTQRHLRADRDRTEVEKTENIVKGHHVVERLEAFSKVLTAETDEEIAKRKRLVMSSGNRALVDEHDDSWRHVRAKSATLPLWLISRDDFCELTRDTPENLTRFVRQALLGPEGRRTTTETAALVKWLRRYRHFSSMSNEQLAIVSRYLRFIHLEPGDSLEPEGAVVYYLLAGKAKLTKPNGDEVSQQARWIVSNRPASLTHVCDNCRAPLGLGRPLVRGTGWRCSAPSSTAGLGELGGVCQRHSTSSVKSGAARPHRAWSRAWQANGNPKSRGVPHPGGRR